MYTILKIELNSGKTFSKNKLKRFYCFLKIFAKNTPYLTKVISQHIFFILNYIHVYTPVHAHGET